MTDKVGPHRIQATRTRRPQESDICGQFSVSIRTTPKSIVVLTVNLAPGDGHELSRWQSRVSVSVVGRPGAALGFDAMNGVSVVVEGVVFRQTD
ncbi:hypothetical protein [Mycolicibacterium senegalense]|uniref:hypothetical protein n=1 Tax=Mycolicibacterium senegalense TaxID=1796 RepID=UPI003633C476